MMNTRKFRIEVCRCQGEANYTLRAALVLAPLERRRRQVTSLQPVLNCEFVPNVHAFSSLIQDHTSNQTFDTRQNHIWPERCLQLDAYESSSSAADNSVAIAIAGAAGSCAADGRRHSADTRLQTLQYAPASNHRRHHRYMGPCWLAVDCSDEAIKTGGGAVTADDGDATGTEVDNAGAPMCVGCCCHDGCCGCCWYCCWE